MIEYFFIDVHNKNHPLTDVHYNESEGCIRGLYQRAVSVFKKLKAVKLANFIDIAA